MKQYNEPILATMFNLFAGLCCFGLLPATIMLFSDTNRVSVIAFVSLLLNAFFFAGFAQVMGLIAKTAHHAERAADAVERMTFKQVEAPKPTRAPANTDPLGLHKEPAFYYSNEGANEGPFTWKDLLDFKTAGVINDETFVLREGETEWRTFAAMAE